MICEIPTSPKIVGDSETTQVGEGNLLTKDELTSKERVTDASSHKKIGLQIAASKKLRQAEKIIIGLCKGIFLAISTGK